MALFHGFTGRGESWRPVIRRLHALDPELDPWAPDLPGHQGPVPGGSLPPNFETCLDLLAERTARACSGAVHLVGYSLGGRLALGLALRHPERFSALTLIGVRPGLDRSARRQRADADERLASDLESQGLEEFVRSWQRLPLFASQENLPPAVLTRQTSLRLSHDPAALAWALRTLSPGRMPDYRPHLRSLPMPVHLIVGELDATYRAIAAEMVESLPRGTVTHIANTGHNVPLEDPEKIAHILSSDRSAETVQDISEEAP